MAMVEFTRSKVWRQGLMAAIIGGCALSQTAAPQQVQAVDLLLLRSV